MAKNKTPAAGTGGSRGKRNAIATKQSAIPTPTGDEWKVGDTYKLHVHGDGTEEIFPDGPAWARETLSVRILEVGTDFVVEETWVRTIKAWPVFHAVRPRGLGWGHVAGADAHTDKETCWRRTRTWEVR